MSGNPSERFVLDPLMIFFRTRSEEELGLHRTLSSNVAERYRRLKLCSTSQSKKADVLNVVVLAGLAVGAPMSNGTSKRAVSAMVVVLVVTHEFPGVTRRHDDRGADLQRHAKCDGV